MFLNPPGEYVFLIDAEASFLLLSVSLAYISSLKKLKIMIPLNTYFPETQ